MHTSWMQGGHRLQKKRGKATNQIIQSSVNENFYNIYKNIYMPHNKAESKYRHWRLPVLTKNMIYRLKILHHIIYQGGNACR